MGRRGRGLCLWQPPHVCLCGSAGLPGVEAWLRGDDCYSTGVGFKNAFLMGMHFTGKSSEVWEASITAAGYRSSACAGVARWFISGNSLPSAAGHMNNRSFSSLVLFPEVFALLKTIFYDRHVPFLHLKDIFIKFLNYSM